MSETAPHETPLVTILTINFNGLTHLETFLPSVAALDFDAQRLELIIVDNGSTDGSLAYLREQHPDVLVIENGANLGFAQANNIGAEAARGRYLCLLNNDMKLEPDWLTRMVDHKQSQPPDVACVASRILNWDGSAVDFINSGMAFNGQGFQLDHGVPTHSPAGTTYPTELLFACGGALLIDKAVYLDVGGLDADYFAYYEDVDLGWRLWVLGFRVTFCPEAVVYHRHNATSAQFGQYKKNVLLERNALYSCIKNYDERSLNVLWPAALLLAVKRLAVRSGVPREAYRFTLASAPSAPVPVPAEPDGAKFWRALRREGLKPAVKKGLLKLAARVQARWGPPAPVLAPDGRHLIHPEAYATVVGLEDLLDHLPGLLAKRALIQAKRRRSDGEVFKLFKLPYQPTEGQGDYGPVFARAIAALGVEGYMAARMAEGPAAGVPRE